MEKAREALLQEFNIIETIRLQRLIKLAILNLLPSCTVKELEERSKFKVIDPDTSDDENEQDQKHENPHNLEMARDFNNRKEKNDTDKI